METKFTSDIEILFFALKKETQTRNAYRLIAKKMDDPQMSQLFEEMADNERVHQQVIELELMKKGIVVKPASEDEKPEFPFLDMEKAMADIETMELSVPMALLLAIEREEYSFALYVDLIAKARDETGRDLLLELAEEEIRHKIELEQRYFEFVSRGTDEM